MLTAKLIYMNNLNKVQREHYQYGFDYLAERLRHIDDLDPEINVFENWLQKIYPDKDKLTGVILGIASYRLKVAHKATFSRIKKEKHTENLYEYRREIADTLLHTAKTYLLSAKQKHNGK